MRIESPDGLFKYTSRQTQFLGNSVVVYQKYMGMAPLGGELRTTTDKYMAYSSTRKFCRFCDDGQWSDIENCVSLKCEKEGLTGEPELLFISNNVKPPAQQTLFEPYSVLGVYTFGGQKFCKQCKLKKNNNKKFFILIKIFIS